MSRRAMRRGAGRFASAGAAVLALALGACGGDEPSGSKDATTPDDVVVDAAGDATGDAGPDVLAGDPVAQAAILALPETAAFELKGLHGPVQIVQDGAGVPHIYASDAHDLDFAHGFVIGRDRWFVVDMGRRLGQGRVAELLGEAALDSDIESRQSAMAFVAARIAAVLTPAQQARFDAFAAGLNAYREAVLAGTLPPPSEMVLAAPLLGKKSAPELMEPFTREDVAGFAAVLVYQLGYETGDVGRGKTAAQIDGWFKGVASEELRRKGAIADLWEWLAPVEAVSSSTGWGLETAAGPPPPPPEPRGGAGLPTGAAGAATRFVRSPKVEPTMVARLAAQLDAFEKRLGRDEEAGFGSNAWAVAAAGTVDGRALLAGDGHLPLTIPSLFYQIGLDDAVFGGGERHQVGLVIPGLPQLAVGTNGQVAWCQTQLMGDITDWYVEQLTLGPDGRPESTLFQGKQEPVKAFEETIQVADIKSPLFPSKGGPRTFTRWTTFDGRWIASIEGEVVKEGHDPGAGKAVVNLGGKWVVPGDLDNDGVVTAISFDYTGLDDGNLLLAVDGFGHSADVDDFREATRSLVAYSQNLVAADVHGDVYYSGYQAVPCRGYLARESDGRWKDGADPNGLLDGTTYGGFTIPIQDGVVDEGPGKDDPYRCVVPFEKYPAAKSPKQGFVLTANNDLGGASLDGRIDNDPWYIGGPWTAGFRARRIEQTLASLVAGKKASVETMQALQADIRSPLGARFAPDLRAAIAKAKAVAAAGPKDDDEARLVALYQSLTPTVDDVDARLATWAERGFPAASGVETFYHPGVDAAERGDAVATAIFNRWFARFGSLVLDDEPMPGVSRFSGSTFRARTLDRLLAGRGASNPLGLVSWNSATGESIFFDRLGTEAVERSEELALQALGQALDFLRSAPKGTGRGGFGSDDLDTWLWGLRHLARFESTIADFFTGDGFSAITDQFAIQTDKLPLLSGDPKAPGKFEKGDPRIGLTWFPRGGDAFVVDAAGGGWGGDDAWYGSGPVFRMVIALGSGDRADKGGVGGANVLPGGQSGLNDSPHFADQAALWLGNQALPLHWHVADVVAGAKSRVALRPPAP